MEKSPQSLSPLSAADLRWSCDPNQFPFKSTDELPELEGLLGQARATSAIDFGVGMRRDGYNLYVLGPPGSGKRTVVRNYLEKRAAHESPPADWLYVNNFADEDRPTAIQLPAGKGQELESDMAQLVEDLQSAIPSALEAEDHRRKIEQMEREFHDQHEQSLNELAEEAHSNGLEMIRTPTGVALAPMKEGKVIGPEDFDKLKEKQREEIEAAVEKLQPKLQKIIQKLPELKKLAREKVKALNREVTRFAIQHLITPLKQKYKPFTKVTEHLDAVEADVIEHSDEFRSPAEAAPVLFMQQAGPSLGQYLVNVVVDNRDSKGAPVVFEDHPHYHNLIGRVEHESHMGSLVTDFSLIKSGALHRANGGYLVVQIRDLLMQPFSWEALKRSLRSRNVNIESLGAALSLISTVSLQPEPIPLDVKVVLLGDRLLYYLLQQYDPDFDELFKVAADFNDQTDCTAENLQLYAQMLASLAKADKTLALDPSAVAAIIEQAARFVGDKEKLSTHMRSIADLLRESNYWAETEKARLITRDHVRKAVDQHILRSDRIRERVHEEIQRGTLLVDTEGERIGQVNGLSVLALGNASFGKPSRITATARLGRGKVIDIERESELGGSIHSKGVMILSSLLAARYATDCPLSLSATVVFEQSYGLVEGDSASMAELCALLSVLASVPIKQGWAITGSVNQHGQAQPIGGVNEKIEGFYDVCKAKGITGEQAVLIPASNVKHLMLRLDVVEAAARGQFAVYGYESVDDAITLLTGVDAGERDAYGVYPPDSINCLVDRRLHELAETQRSFGDKTEHGLL